MLMVISEDIGYELEFDENDRPIKLTDQPLTELQINNIVDGLTRNLNEQRIFWTKLPINKNEFVIAREVTPEQLQKDFNFTAMERLQLSMESARISKMVRST